MRNLFLFLAIVITVFVVMFANYNLVPDLNLVVMYTDIKFQMSFFALCLIIFSLGIITGVFIMLKAVFTSAIQNQNIKRKLEKTSIGADDSELRVKTLENKVKTLETALDKAIKKED